MAISGACDLCSGHFRQHRRPFQDGLIPHDAERRIVRGRVQALSDHLRFAFFGDQGAGVPDSLTEPSIRSTVIITLLPPPLFGLFDPA